MSNEELQVEEPALLASWDEGIKDFAQSDEVWPMDLPNGKQCRVKGMADANAILRLQRHARITADAASVGMLPDIPGERFEKDITLACVMVSTLVIEPPMSLRQALRISKECGSLIMLMSVRIEEHNRDASMKREEEVVMEAKNGSGQTGGGDASLLSAGTSEESTPTN